MKKFYISILAGLLLFPGCFEDFDDTISPASTLEIQNFIYRGLNYFYLYKADTPELANDAFLSNDDKNSFTKINEKIKEKIKETIFKIKKSKIRSEENYLIEEKKNTSLSGAHTHKSRIYFRAEIKKYFVHFFGSNENCRICFRDYLTFMSCTV